MRSVRRLGASLTCLTFVGVLSGLLLAADDKPALAKKHALLVGCTVYPNTKVSELYGPANDVKLWAGLLDRFGFPRKNITTLVGWPDEAKKRPTFANIAAAWETLIAQADADTQLFIVMSGHGVQIPIPETQSDPLDPKNPEPDGLDEVFLPADVENADAKGGLKNHLLDNQVGAWLDQLRAKGASVWIVFDCCHSGTMERGAEDERPREVRPQELGITEKQLREAAERAKKAVDKAVAGGERPRGAAAIEASALGLGKSSGKGSVVAFYAAQAFETAPELPRPITAPRTRENYYGLMSYTLVKTLEQRGGAMSYRQLAQLLAGTYAADRGARPPTPFCEGDLDREVFGLRQWPKGGDILLSRDDEGGLHLNAGEVRGLTLGSVLAVHAEIGKKDARAIVGHVKVTALTPVSANVAPCSDPEGKNPAVKAAALPALAPCTLVSRDFGDLRLKLTVRAASADGPLAKKVALLLKELPKETQAMFELVSDEAKAQYFLWCEGDKVFWKTSLGPVAAPMSSGGASKGAGAPSRLYGGYPSAELTPERLERDIQTLFTWQNVWRIGGSLANRDAAKEAGLKFIMEKTTAGGVGDGELTNGHPVAPGQKVRFKVVNEGLQHLWVTLLFMDGDFGIGLRSLSLKSGTETKWFTGSIKGDTAGKEGIVVLGVSMDVSREAPSFEFLEQPRLRAKKAPSLADKFALARNTGDSPFQQLMTSAALGKGTRSFQEDAPSNPAIITWSWLTMPGKNDP